MAHDMCWKSPRSPAIVGSAVATIVWSSAASSVASIIALKAMKSWRREPSKPVDTACMSPFYSNGLMRNRQARSAGAVDRVRQLRVRRALEELHRRLEGPAAAGAGGRAEDGDALEALAGTRLRRTGLDRKALLALLQGGLALLARLLLGLGVAGRALRGVEIGGLPLVERVLPPHDVDLLAAGDRSAVRRQREVPRDGAAVR